MSGFRILVADDHEIVRHGISSLLSDRSGWEVCAAAGNGREAVEKAKELRPDLVILDLHMPSLNGMEAARQILRDNPQQRILVLTVTDFEQMAQELLRVGAKGYLLKSDAATDLIKAVEALQLNRTFFNSGIEQMVLESYLNGGGASLTGTCGVSNLTSREREVVQLLAEGKTTKEVAVALGLSVKTAETHRSNIMRKLDLHSVRRIGPLRSSQRHRPRSSPVCERCRHAVGGWRLAPLRSVEHFSFTDEFLQGPGSLHLELNRFAVI